MTYIIMKESIIYNYQIISKKINKRICNIIENVYKMIIINILIEKAEFNYQIMNQIIFINSFIIDI